MSEDLEFELDLGRSKGGGRVYANVRLSYEANGPKPAGLAELGISFEHTPKGARRHQSATAYGQLGDIEFEPETLGHTVRFVWRGYHLNALHAGCEHQRAAGWERDREPSEAGPRVAHVSEPCPVCGYGFGTAWKVVPLPEDVVTLVKSWAGK